MISLKASCMMKNAKVLKPLGLRLSSGLGNRGGGWETGKQNASGYDRQQTTGNMVQGLMCQRAWRQGSDPPEQP